MRTTCDTCGVDVTDTTGSVAVIARRWVRTEYFEGHERAGEERITAAGTFCVEACAASWLMGRAPDPRKVPR